MISITAVIASVFGGSPAEPTTAAATGVAGKFLPRFFGR